MYSEEANSEWANEGICINYWARVLYSVSLDLLEKGSKIPNISRFPKKKNSGHQGLASVKLQGSTNLTGIGLDIRYYGALATIRVWLPLTSPFSVIE